MAGSTAIRVPKAVSVIRRSAASSSAYGSSGATSASPAPCRRSAGVSPPTAAGAPTGAVTAAATASDAASPRSPTTWVPTRRVSTR